MILPITHSIFHIEADISIYFFAGVYH